MWELLDPTPRPCNHDDEVDGHIPSAATNDRSRGDGDAAAAGLSQSPSATIQVTTRFTQPVEDDTPARTGETASLTTILNSDDVNGTTPSGTMPTMEESMGFTTGWDGELEQLSTDELFLHS